MKRIFIPLIGLFASVFSYAQPQTKPVSAEQQIIKLMNDWMRALMKKDTATLDKLIAPEFTISNVSRAHFDNRETLKEGWMNNSDDLKVDSVHYDKMKVYVVDNVAVVKSTFYWKGFRRNGIGSPDPNQTSRNFIPFVDSTVILVDTWLKRKQGWQVINRLRVDDPQLYQFERQNKPNKPQPSSDTRQRSYSTALRGRLSA